ncbi:MAG: GNAT family N-acetyltransferase [Mycobacteriaceae bacterium]
MEPIEINAGTWYLRALRADEKVDDRPVLLTAAADPDTERYAPVLPSTDLAAATDYVRRRELQWTNDSWYSWAVCEPATGEMLAEVGLRHLEPRQRSAELACWTAPAHRRQGVMTNAIGAVLRLAFAAESLGGLGLHRVGYLHAEGNAASAALAARCGLSGEGRMREAVLIDGQRRDLLLLARLATD